MDVHIIVLISAFLGIGITGYLRIQHIRKKPPVCIIGHSCETVWESPYSKTLGIGNDILGLIFYVAAVVVELAVINGCTSPFIIAGERVLLGMGAAMSVYFTFLQWQVIKAWCFWCTASAVLTWIMFFGVLAA
ncbi:MAG: vitamin K epoxide reductase family protein [Candidatus Paceibacterota bacterium]|jgi:uncharacterized membrane protein